jgi:signal transduction histidine kinase
MSSPRPTSPGSPPTKSGASTKSVGPPDRRSASISPAKSRPSALANLLSNAVKFTPPGKVIRVGLSSDGKDVALAVEDEGIGIPPDETARIFEKFFQGRNAVARSVKGTGLGLTLVKHTVEAHGGKVLVESRLGQGSRFTLIFPMKS